VPKKPEPSEPQRPQRRSIRRAARALRDHSRRVVDYERRDPQYAIVRTNKPAVAAELSESNLKLERDEIVYSQWVTRFDREHGIEPGDSLYVTPMPNGEWLATDVVTDRDVDWEGGFEVTDLTGTTIGRIKKKT
jgi:hypothetical protein